MELFGKTYGFKLTVGASAELAKACPDGDMNRIGELLKPAFVSAFSGSPETATVFLLALNRGYEQARAFAEPGCEPARLTAELIAAMDFVQFNTAMTEAMQAFRLNGAPSVGAEPAKKNGDADSESR